MTANLLKLRSIYKQAESNLETMGRNVLKLIRHPDTTPEQLETTRNAYATAYSKWAEIRFKLRQKHPESSLPWSVK